MANPLPALYEIAGDLGEIGDALLENGGELTDDIAARLDALDDAFEQKVERVALYRQSLRRGAEAAKAEADRLAQLATVRANAAKRLDDYVLRCFDQADRTKIETDRVRVRVQKNGRPAIKWTGDPTDPPAGFMRVVISFDSTLAREALAAGESLPDGVIVEHGRHVRVS